MFLLHQEYPRIDILMMPPISSEHYLCIRGNASSSWVSTWFHSSTTSIGKLEVAIVALSCLPIVTPPCVCVSTPFHTCVLDIMQDDHGIVGVLNKSRLDNFAPNHFHAGFTRRDSHNIHRCSYERCRGISPRGKGTCFQSIPVTLVP